MNTTDKLLLLGGVALAAAAVIYWRHTVPRQAPLASLPGGGLAPPRPRPSGTLLIDSGQGYAYSIDPEHNPLAFDKAGNVINLPAGARVIG